MQEGLRAIGDTEVLKKIVSPRNDLSQRRQCELLGLNRTCGITKPAWEDPANLELMRLMDEEYMEHPTNGVLGMVYFLRAMSILTGPKCVRRLLYEAIGVHGKPEIVNSDQSSQFMCPGWIEYLENQEITISMDGKCRALDNVWIECFWHTLKQEYVYICPAGNGNMLRNGLTKCNQ